MFSQNHDNQIELLTKIQNVCLIVHKECTKSWSKHKGSAKNQTDIISIREIAYKYRKIAANGAS